MIAVAMPRPSSNSLSEQKKLLAARQALLAKELAMAEKQARQKAKPARATLEPERRLRVSTTPDRVLPPRPREHLFPQGERVRTTRNKFRRRKTEAKIQQIKFLLLCLIFVTLIVLIWKNFP
ncbi:MAG: hypothetical protein ACO3G9_10050 [Chthoniobacterales bacterium]